MVVATSAVAACGDTPDPDPAAGGSTTTGAGGAGGAPAPDFPEGYEHLGNVATFPPGTFKPIPAKEMIVCHDDLGVYAMTSRCTHQNCDMNGNDGTSGDGITTCGCHGSVYNPNGEVIQGPAVAPLAHFSVLIDDAGNIGINQDIIVDIDERAVPPA